MSSTNFLPPSGSSVMVAMSGGVDSSATAALLVEHGCRVVGVTMCLGIRQPDETGKRCCSPQAVADARRVCDSLDIPHYVFDYTDVFEQAVVTNFRSEYARGRTPNPCVRCNSAVKFDNLLKKARVMGFEFLATGHYARIFYREGVPCLCRGVDHRKDQSYFLAGIEPAALQYITFPLAGSTKEEVREQAARAGLAVAQKRESQDLCFVDDDSYRTLIVDGTVPGEIVTTRGEVLGRHPGIAHVTVGQRKGLGLTAGVPLYVTEIDSSSNRVIVGERHELASAGLEATCLTIYREPIPLRLAARIRSTHTPAPCSVRVQESQMCVMFDTPQDAVTPGQLVVLYDREMVIASGIIESRIR